MHGDKIFAYMLREIKLNNSAASCVADLLENYMYRYCGTYRAFWRDARVSAPDTCSEPYDRRINPTA